MVNKAFEHVVKEAVNDFSQVMVEKMIVNEHKGTQWARDPVQELVQRLHEEVRELVDAIAYDVGEPHVSNEAADVANFAMMIRDAYKRAKENV